MSTNNTNPEHYKKHPSGVECIQVSQHFNFNLGNVIKYVWRADHKAGAEDLEKAKRYLEFEIERRKSAETSGSKIDIQSLEKFIEKRKSHEKEAQSGANPAIPIITYADPKCRNCKHWKKFSHGSDRGQCFHVEQELETTHGHSCCEHFEP